MASGHNSSTLRFPITSSTRYFDVAGRTRPDARLTSIRTSPRKRRPRRAQISCFACCQAVAKEMDVLALSGTLTPPREWLRSPPCGPNRLPILIDDSPVRSSLFYPNPLEQDGRARRLAVHGRFLDGLENLHA